MLFGSEMFRLFKICSIGCLYCMFLLLEKLKLCVDNDPLIIICYSMHYFYSIPKISCTAASKTYSCLYSSSINLLHLLNIELDPRVAEVIKSVHICPQVVYGIAGEIGK